MQAAHPAFQHPVTGCPAAARPRTLPHSVLQRGLPGPGLRMCAVAVLRREQSVERQLRLAVKTGLRGQVETEAAQPWPTDCHQ